MIGRHIQRASRLAYAGLAAAAAAALAVTGVVTSTLPAAATSASSSSCPSASTSIGARAGHIAGIVRAVHSSGSCANALGGDPHNSGGHPPLVNHGGPVMSTKASGNMVTVTPIYWAPAGYSFSSSYKSLINRYLSDAAKDSDKSTNVFSTLFEYSGNNGAINYKLKRGKPLADTNAFPAAGCTTDAGPVYNDNSGYTTCLDDAQVISEVDAQVTALGLRRDLGHMYVMFLPKHVESCFYAGRPSNQACTINLSSDAAYCAYHSEFTGPTVYANMPFPIYEGAAPYTCASDASFPTVESPNNNADADVEISPLSHEMSEAITDPDTSTGWYDSGGYENGDECAYMYGASSGAAGAMYNQTINGHHYLTQEEFSNNNFNLGQGGCLQNYIPAAAPTVTKLSKTSGGTAGGTVVTITGTTLAGADGVFFGSTPATTFSVVDSTHLKATSPAHAAGTVDVTVHNVLGTSPPVSADHFTYS